MAAKVRAEQLTVFRPELNTRPRERMTTDSQYIGSVELRQEP